MVSKKVIVVLAFVVIVSVVSAFYVLYAIGSELGRQQEQKGILVESHVAFLEQKGYTVYRASTYFTSTNKKIKYATFEEWYQVLEGRETVWGSEKYEVYLKGSTFWFEYGSFEKEVWYVEV